MAPMSTSPHPASCPSGVRWKADTWTRVVVIECLGFQIFAVETLVKELKAHPGSAEGLVEIQERQRSSLYLVTSRPDFTGRTCVSASLSTPALTTQLSLAFLGAAKLWSISKGPQLSSKILITNKK